jgi:hypothetical protein
MELTTRIERPPYKAKYSWAEDIEGNSPAHEIKQIIERILAAHGLLTAFHKGAHFGARIDAEPFLPLTVTKHERHVNIGQFFQRACGTYFDPAMNFEIGKDEAWYPISVELADGNCRQCADGPLLINFEERRKQSFAAKWAADLLLQGYDRGKVSKRWREND